MHKTCKKLILIILFEFRYNSPPPPTIIEFSISTPCVPASDSSDPDLGRDLRLVTTAVQRS